jgi:hypothetical protein
MIQVNLFSVRRVFIYAGRNRFDENARVIVKKMISIAALIALAAAIPAVAQSEAKKVYQASHVNPHAPKIDGLLDDPVWDKVAWEGGFVQFRPVERESPAEKTEFKIVYDDSSLYVAVRCWDSQADKIERRLSRRDDIGGDSVEVTLDSYFDHLTGFAFAVNAAGVKADSIYSDSSNSNGPDYSWDPIWDVETAVDGKGWSAEMRIPFSQIRFGNKDEQVWGLQISRSLFRKDETSLWQFIPRTAPGWVSFFGELHGLQGLKPPRQIELLPYTVARQQLFRPVPGNPFATGSSRNLAGGLDGKVGVTSDLTMTFTINPDFGQVEADPSVVNLTAFETYFSEKRPFFIEGRNIINFQIMGGDGDFSSDNLFYSRRIGRSPQFYPDTSAQEFVDQPEATSILGAFKLTGKTKSGLSIGVMETVTARERARLFSDGMYADQTVEPLTSYFAARLQQDFNRGGTTLGAMLTATLRDPRREATLDFLHDAAYTGGLDFSHSWRNKTYYFSLKTVFSSVMGTPEAILRTQESPLRYFQRPDAHHLRLDPGRTSLTGHGGTLSFGKGGGGNIAFSLGCTWRSPGLELNDMGYLRQSDVIMEWTWMGYRITKPFSLFRNVSFNLNQWQGWNFGSEPIFSGGNINGGGQFKNYWEVWFGIGRNGESLSASALRGGPSLRQAAALNIWFDVESDSRKSVRFYLNGGYYGRDNGDSREIWVGAGSTIIPGPAFQLSLSPSFDQSYSALQYVSTQDVSGQTRYIFGAIEQKTVALTVRLSYCLTPELSIQFYGMPFLSAGRYDGFKHITDSRSRDWGGRYHVYDSSELAWDEAAGAYSVTESATGLAYAFDRPDFNFVQFRSNLVIRWEYIPGSTLYLVWSQGRTGFEPRGDFSFGRDVDNLFNIHPHNVFLVKFSYCFQL